MALSFLYETVSCLESYSAFCFPDPVLTSKRIVLGWGWVRWFRKKQLLGEDETCEDFINSSGDIEMNRILLSTPYISNNMTELFIYWNYHSGLQLFSLPTTQSLALFFILLTKQRDQKMVPTKDLLFFVILCLSLCPSFHITFPRNYNYLYSISTWVFTMIILVASFWSFSTLSLL